MVEDCCAGKAVLVLIVFGNCEFRFVVDVASSCEILVLVEGILKQDIPGSSPTAHRHLVRIRTLWRGISNFLRALPTISSETPLL